MHRLPFQVGQLAESRSFEDGYRGAWFRCKIRKISYRKGVLAHLMEYIDYPDQEMEWIKVYQKAPGSKNKSKGIKRQLMVRPWFPTIYRESEKHDISTISETIVIVENAWKVRDLVDWRTDGCYWSGRIAEILENGKFKIDLLPRPMGEGSTYEAFGRDFRPSLDWCPEKGWTVPMPMLLDGGTQRPCASLIKPEHREDVLNPNAADRIVKVVQTSTNTSLECTSSPCSQNTVNCLESVKGLIAMNNTTKNEDVLNPNAADRIVKVVQTSTNTSLECTSSSPNTENCLESLKGPIAVNNTTENGTELEVVDTSIRKTNSSDSAPSPSSHNRAESDENVRLKAVNDGLFQRNPSKKMRKDISICLDSMFVNSMEDTISDLEELVNRIKYIRGILESGMPLSSTSQSFWKFCPHDAPCLEK